METEASEFIGTVISQKKFRAHLRGALASVLSLVSNPLSKRQEAR